MRRAIPVVLAVNFGLVLLGVLLYPTVMNEGGLLGICADIVVLTIYGFLALFSPIALGKINSGLLNRSVLLGLIGGLGLVIDLVSDYLIGPTGDYSATSSLTAYGIFLLLLLISAILAAQQTRKFISGISAAIWSVLTALLLWFFVEFTAFYLFATTPSGTKFIQLEMQTDFERSKSTDFQGFVMSDFYGAGFFHLLLGLFFACFLGSIGGLIGKAFHKN